MPSVWPERPSHETPKLFEHCSIVVTDSGKRVYRLTQGRLPADFWGNAAFIQSEQNRFSIFVIDGTCEQTYEAAVNALVIRPIYVFHTDRSKYQHTEDEGFFISVPNIKEQNLFIRAFRSKHLQCWLRNGEYVLGFRRELLDPAYYSNYSACLAPTHFEFDLETRQPIGCPESIARRDPFWLRTVINIKMPLCTDNNVHAYQNERRRRAAVKWAEKFKSLHKMVPPLPDRSREVLSWEAVLQDAEMPYLVASDGALVGTK
ncbi:MAG: hypothetical protein ACLPID_21140 [Beijerinckiaceae bacterium]